jgi:hypothetical protein
MGKMMKDARAGRKKPHEDDGRNEKECLGRRCAKMLVKV